MPPRVEPRTEGGDLNLLDPKRSAHASIRGYLYQTCLGVLRWLDLRPNEILLCEGDEDLDRFLLGGGAVSEQVKAYTDGLSITDRVVRDSLRNFLRSYVTLRQRGEDRKFVFTTTAPYEKKQRDGLNVDLLEAWRGGDRTAEVITEVRSLVEPPERDPKRAEVEAASLWLDSQSEGWAGFMSAVEWSFDAPDLDALRGEIERKLQAERSALAAVVLLDRLIVHLLKTSSQKEVEKRVLTKTDIDAQVGAFLADLGRAASSEAVRIRSVFEEVDNLRDLLDEGTRRLPENPTPGKILTAAYEVIPFQEMGRQEELAFLASWCESKDRHSVLLLTGEGGSGKTRFMLEWCHRLRHQGWHAGFLKRNREKDQILPLVKGTAPRLVVIDYAETRLGIVEPLLVEMGQAPQGEGPTLRVVLLARREADWWKNLALRSGDVAELLAHSEQRSLSALASENLAERQQAFQNALEGFAEGFQREIPKPLKVPDLSGPRFDQALYLHMAALAALGGEKIETAEDALEQTLDHERRFWRGQVEGLGLSRPQQKSLSNGVESAVAAVTLVGGTATVEQTRGLLTRVLPSPGNRDTVIDLLSDLYRASVGEGGRYLDPLQPDLLGEQWVAKVLAQDEELLARILDGASPEEGKSTLTVLTRLARRRSDLQRWIGVALHGRLEQLGEIALDVAVETGDPVGVELARELEISDSIELILRLHERHGQERYRLSVTLREVALVVIREVLAHRNASWEHPTDEQQEELAVLGNNLCLAFKDLGRPDESLAHLLKAVETHRRLSAQNPGKFLHHLPLALGNLGEVFSDLRRPEEALRCTSEAVDIYRDLIKERGEPFLLSLALNLGNLGGKFADVGMPKEALESTQEAANTFLKLHSFPSSHLALAFVKILKNLANRLSELGRRQEALHTAESAVNVCRKFAWRRPDIFDPELAGTLNNLGNRLDDAGRMSEAVSVLEETVTIYRHLAERRPEAFLLRLATCLSNLSAPLNRLGRHQDALTHSEAALQILREMSTKSPNTFEKEIAGTLINIGACSSALDLEEKAEAAYRESIELHRKLAEQRPNAFAPALHLALNNLGDMLRKRGQLYEALEILNKAVDIGRLFVEPRPELTLSLFNLGLVRRDIGDLSGASELIEESIGALRPFFLREPNCFREWMQVIVKAHRRLEKLRGSEPDPSLVAEIERLL